MAKTKHLFLTTIFLLVVVFILGMLIGRWLSSSRVDEITNFIRNNELDTEAYLIEQDLLGEFEEGNCEIANVRISNLGNDLWELGKSLSPEDAEERLGKDNYFFMKRKYHLLQIRNYILFYDLKKHCDNTGSVVLFYYSKGDDQSEQQGKILDRVVRDYGINVFAIEYNYSEELSFMEEYYNVDKTPTLIIEYNTILEGLTSYEEIKEALEK